MVKAERKFKRMVENEVRKNMKSIIQSVLNKQESHVTISNDEINDETNLSVDLGMDSIEIITVIAEIESEYDIEFDYEDMDIDNITIFGSILKSLIKAISHSSV